MIDFYAEAGFTLARAAAENTFRALLAAPDLGRVWLLESDREPAGFVVLTVAFSMEYGGLRGFVDDFFVSRPYRRRGLGASALQAVKDECLRRGVRALLVETGPDNASALGVYRRAGFADTGHLLLALALGPQVHTGGPASETDLEER
jgi:GNAT superfamily N-acetyltransferase